MVEVQMVVDGDDLWSRDDGGASSSSPTVISEHL